MRKPNPLKEKLAGPGALFGTWAQMSSPDFCEMAARSGMDFVLIDMEHGEIGIESATQMMRAVEAAGGAPLVRVPDGSRIGIGKALDAGAMAVMVPNVDSAQMAQAVVAASRYAPRGTRGSSPCIRMSGHGADTWAEHLQWSEANTMVSVLVESPAGFDNFEEIIAVPGIDIVALGPFDLSQAMGLEGNWKHPEVQRRQREMVRLARARGLHVLISTFDNDPAELRRQVDGWVEQGVSLFAIAGDRFILSAAYRALNTTLRQASPT